MLPPGGDRAVASSLRPSAGGANEEAMPRARDVAPWLGLAVSKRTSLAAEPGSRSPAGVFSARRGRDPTRLPRIQSAAGGPDAEARSRGQRFEGRRNRGLTPPFGLREPLHPFAKRMTAGPVPGLLPSCRLAMCSSWGLAAFLGHIAEVLRIRFYNRRFAHEHPPRKHPLRRLPAERRGKTRRRSASRSSASGASPPSFAGDAGPPCGHPASNGSVLDGTSPASGREAAAPALSRGAERAWQLFRPLHASPVEPSGASGDDRRENARALPSPIGDLASTGRTSMLPAFTRPRRLPSKKPGSSTLASVRPEPRARWPAGTGAARVHRCSKTSTRPFFTPLSRAFPGRMRFHDFCRSMFQRALRWTARTSRASGKPWPGRLPARSIVAFRSRQPPKVLRVRGRGFTEPRRSLPGLLPGETLPQPRSLQTPRVADIVRRPVRS
jgi:hypothetical protein